MAQDNKPNVVEENKLVEVVNNGESKNPDSIDAPDLPKEVKEVMSFMMQASSGPVPLEILKKVSPEHISKTLDLAGRQQEIHSQHGFSIRKYVFCTLVLAMIFIITLIYLLKDQNTELLNQIMTILVIFAGGFGAGYGYCKQNK
ncbi:MAG: hypothetical protein PHG85_01055 [Candidatus Altiarchaeota archaeon]|nr:hypothetical protein [Candidatus Altiarchaeota archaeon]